MNSSGLSLSSINDKAPYQVRSENGYSFQFRTAMGISYEIAFVEDHMISDDVDGIGYYMAILGRKDNPLLPDRLDSFERLFKQIAGK